MVTAKDVAAAAGISQPTVSAVLHGKARALRISSKTEQLVIDTAKRLGYHPNLFARALREGKSHNIGIFMPAPRENCYADFIGEFERMLPCTNYTAVYGFWDSIPAAKRALPSLLSRQLDGLITVEPDLLPAQLDCPVVSMFSASKRYDSVSVDWADAFRSIIRYLKSMGHSRIAYAGATAEPSGGRFSQIFLDILKEENLSSDYLTDMVQSTKLANIGSGVSHLVAWIQSLKTPPTAIVMPNDAGAICLIGALQVLGIRVPEDVSVVGMDNIVMSSWIHPPLTTFDFFSHDGIPMVALNRLLERLEHPDLPREDLLVKATILVRGSTGPVRS